MAPGRRQEVTLPDDGTLSTHQRGAVLTRHATHRQWLLRQVRQDLGRTHGKVSFIHVNDHLSDGARIARLAECSVALLTPISEFCSQFQVRSLLAVGNLSIGKNSFLNGQIRVPCLEYQLVQR